MQRLQPLGWLPLCDARHAHQAPALGLSPSGAPWLLCCALYHGAELLQRVCGLQAFGLRAMAFVEVHKVTYVGVQCNGVPRIFPGWGQCLSELLGGYGALCGIHQGKAQTTNAVARSRAGSGHGGSPSIRHLRGDGNGLRPSRDVPGAGPYMKADAQGQGYPSPGPLCLFTGALLESKLRLSNSQAGLEPTRHTLRRGE